MKMNKKLIIFLLWCLPTVTMAAGGGIQLSKADINLENKNSLRAGAKLFVNYCLSCHSASYMRYNRIAKDLELTDDQVEDNLMFIGDFRKSDSGELKKIGELMTIAMKSEDAKKYFGTAIPDLSVYVRAKNGLFAPSRGADWLYTYLTTFYIDESRPFGVNNLLSSNVAMPHVLWELEGLKKKVVTKDEEGHETVKFEYVTEGKLNEVEYKRAMNDLVNFMVYMGEPIKLERQRIGIIVIFFLVLFFFLAYMLKKEYWKDIH